jgi:hypothetical protein
VAGLAAIRNDRFAWNVASTKMGFGALLVALSLLPLARHLARFGRPDATRLGYLAAAAAVVAAGIGLGGTFDRAHATPETLIYNPPQWPFTIAYVIEPLTMLGLVLAALGLERAGYPHGMTRSLLVPAGILAILALIGYPPLLMYFVAFAFGFALVVAFDLDERVRVRLSEPAGDPPEERPEPRRRSRRLARSPARADAADRG